MLRFTRTPKSQTKFKFTRAFKCPFSKISTEFNTYIPIKMHRSSRGGRKPGLPPRDFKDIESSPLLSVFDSANMPAPHVRRHSFHDDVNIGLDNADGSDDSDDASKASSLSSLSAGRPANALPSLQPYVDIGKQLQVRATGCISILCAFFNSVHFCIRNCVIWSFLPIPMTAVASPALDPART